MCNTSNDNMPDAGCEKIPTNVESRQFAAYAVKGGDITCQRDVEA